MSNNKYKILVVEDDRSILSVIQTVLETNGYQVLTAQRCQQGILMLSSHVPDLVVLDLGLPDMDGEEFIRITRRSSMTGLLDAPLNFLRGGLIEALGYLSSFPLQFL